MSLPPSFLSKTLGRVKQSPTIAVSAKARDLKAARRDILDLSIGEPDFDTPENIKAAAWAAIETGQTKHTAVDGMRELKDAIIRKFQSENSLEYSRSQLSVGTGSKQVIYNALLATMNPGDEVLIPTPCWEGYPDITRLLGGEPSYLPATPETGFKITPAALERAITPATKWFILNSPGNPTGVGYSSADLRALADVLLRHPHVWILSDDMYEHFAYPPFEFSTIAAVEPKLFERTLTVNSMAAAFAMTGWRIGFAGGPEPLIAAMRKAQSLSTACPSSVSQWAAMEALLGPKETVTTFRNTFQRRRDLIVGCLNAIDGIRCKKPDGAFYVFPSIAPMIGRTTPSGVEITTDEVFCAELLEAESVAIVHGGAFGLSPYVRICYATSDELIVEACARIRRFCDSLT